MSTAIKTIVPTPLDLVSTDDLIEEISRRTTNYLIVLVKPDKVSNDHVTVHTATDLPATPESLRAARNFVERAILKGKEPPHDPTRFGP